MGSFVTNAVVHSSTVVHSEDHVLACTLDASEPTLRPPPDLEPSYESTYQELHKAEIIRIRSLVQSPNMGTFMHSDLMWASHMRVKGRRTDPRTLAPVSVAYIPWARVEDFVKGEEARSDAPSKFVCQGVPSRDKGKLLFPRWNSYSDILRCACNMQFVFMRACYSVTQSCQVPTVFYMALTSITCCSPHPTGITVSMDQMTMRRTYHWLQMTCYRRNENLMSRANSYQVERGTQVHGHPRGCEDRANEGGANVGLS